MTLFNIGVNSFFPIRAGRALFLISPRGVFPVGFVSRERNCWAGVWCCCLASLEGDAKEASCEPNVSSSGLIEFIVWASDRGVWMAKWPAVVAMMKMTDDASLSSLSFVER